MPSQMAPKMIAVPRHDQGGGKHGQGERGEEGPHARDLELAVGEVAGEGDDGEELGDLRGLDLGAGYGDPAPGAEGALAQEEDGDEGDDGEGVEGGGHLAE